MSSALKPPRNVARPAMDLALSTSFDDGRWTREDKPTVRDATISYTPSSFNSPTSSFPTSFSITSTLLQAR
ncbi:hypothetical protein FRC03_006403 [Tulasnella sp. 419]|nr:hypothetical protein FRC03_006403 [Tulasnella sp. 419]